MAGNRPPLNEEDKKKSSSVPQMSKDDPQHWLNNPYSAIVAAQKIKYRQYKRDQKVSGKKALTGKQWYEQIYKSGE